MDFQKLVSCLDLTEDHFAEAACTRESTLALLDRIAKICRPHAGEYRLLHFLARVALKDWLDGDLRVTIDFLDLVHCKFRLMFGMGDIYEAIKSLELNASFAEFRNAAADRKNLAPFILTEAIDFKHLAFDASREIRRTTAPPPEFAEAVICVDERSAWHNPPPPKIEPPPALPAPIHLPAAPQRAIAKIPLVKKPISSLPPLPLVGARASKEAETIPAPAPNTSSNAEDVTGIDDDWEE